MYKYIEAILAEDRNKQETIDILSSYGNFITFVAQCSTSKLFPTSFSIN